MLLRAKIRSGEEDLSVFESLLLEDNGAQEHLVSHTLEFGGTFSIDCDSGKSRRPKSPSRRTTGPRST